MMNAEYRSPFTGEALYRYEDFYTCFICENLEDECSWNDEFDLPMCDSCAKLNMNEGIPPHVIRYKIRKKQEENVLL